MKINNKALLLTLTALCVTGCTSNGGTSTSNSNEEDKVACPHVCPDCGLCTDFDSSNEECLEKCECIKYEHLDSYLVRDGFTDYKIVLPAEAEAETYKAAVELNYFMNASTKTIFEIVKDSEFTYANDSKIISIGRTSTLESIGYTVPTLTPSSFEIKTVNNSLILVGGSSIGDLYAVYELLGRTIHMEQIGINEEYYVKTSALYVPDFNFVVSPDIEYRSEGLQFISNNEEAKDRMRFKGIKWIYPVGGSSFHNSFNYFPKDKYLNEHPFFYGGDQICYTAHGSAEEYELMVNIAAEEMKKAFLTITSGYIFTLTQQDADGFCTCDACSKINNKYGTYSAVIIQFMNDVIAKVQPWVEEVDPIRAPNVRYAIFAYTKSTINAPVKEENGKFVPIDEEVIPSDRLSVIYAPITSDFMHDKYSLTNASVFEQMKKWQALVGRNVLYWFYSAYFWNYFVPYNNFDSMQGNYKAAVECGGLWMFDQGHFNVTNATGFNHLKVYLQSKLYWDVNANVPYYTNRFFDKYYKNASVPMRKYFDSMRTHYNFMSEYQNVGGWWGNRVDNPEYFPSGVLREWIGYIDEAYNAIAPVKKTNVKLYNELYDRICLEGLSARFLLIYLYSSDYSSKDLYKLKTDFKEDCDRLSVNMYSEKAAISTLWAEWGL